MARNPAADSTVQIVTDPAQADARVAVVGDQVLTATPADSGKGVVVQPDGSFAVETLGTGGPPSGSAGGDLGGSYPNPTLSTAKQSELDGKADAAATASALAGKADATATTNALNAKADLANPSGTGEATWPSVRATGKSGATATPLILAGGTASGAPSSGAHLKGELVLDDAGQAWFCTVAGTPGTWVKSGSSTFAPIASPTFTGVPAGPVFAASGITGAVAATRYAGGTASGPPATGTFLLGDFVIDQTGQVWICTVAGTPGTWAAPGSGRALGYDDIVSNQTGITGVGTGNKVAITGLSITVTVGARPILLKIRAGNCTSNTAGSGGGIAIVDDADTATLLVQASGHSSAAAAPFSLHAERRIAPSAGAHTYSGYAWATVSGSFSVIAGAQNPCMLMAVEL